MISKQQNSKLNIFFLLTTCWKGQNNKEKRYPGMVRTRGLSFLSCLSRAIWPMPLATTHLINWTAYPSSYFFALLLVTLLSPFLCLSLLPHTQPILSFSPLVSVSLHLNPNSVHHYLCNSTNTYVLLAWQVSSPLEVFSTPLQLSVTLSYLSFTFLLTT